MCLIVGTTYYVGVRCAFICLRTSATCKTSVDTLRMTAACGVYVCRLIERGGSRPGLMSLGPGNQPLMQHHLSTRGYVRAHPLPPYTLSSIIQLPVPEWRISNWTIGRRSYFLCCFNCLLADVLVEVSLSSAMEASVDHEPGRARVSQSLRFYVEPKWPITQRHSAESGHEQYRTDLWKQPLSNDVHCPMFHRCDFILACVYISVIYVRFIAHIQT